MQDSFWPLTSQWNGDFSGGQLLCFRPFLTAQRAKPRAYRQLFGTFQPFQAHISGQEGRNDTL